MKLLSTLRWQNFKKTLPGPIACILAGVLVFFWLGAYELPRLIKPLTFAEVDPQNMHGVYIEDEVHFIYARYVDELSGTGQGPDVIIGIQYLIDLNDEYYVSLYVHSGQIAQAIRLEDASFDYSMGETEEGSYGEWPTLYVKGSFVPMEEQVEQYYYELAGGDSGIEAIMLPYTLDSNMVGTANRGLAGFALVSCIALVALGCVLLYFAITGKYERKIWAELEARGSKEFVLERFNHFYRTTPPHYRFRINEEFMLFQQGKHSVLLHPRDVVWAYKQDTKYIGFGFPPTFKAYAIRLHTQKGEVYTLSYKKKQQNSVIDYLARHLPQASIGCADTSAANGRISYGPLRSLFKK